MAAPAAASQGSTPPLEVTQWDKSMVNTVQVIGNVGFMEAKALPSGLPITILSLALQKPQRPQDAASSAQSESMWCAVAPGWPLRPPLLTTRLVTTTTQGDSHGL